jgi:hypothetical protein
MGARPVTLDGGSITGLGTLSSTGTISGYGTISSLITGTSFSATATDGTAFGGFSPFVNGTPGTPITLIGQTNLTSDSFTVSNHGDFNFQGVTLTTPTLNGVSTNLNAGSLGGNNYYGLFTFSGAASTIVGNVNNTNYQQFDINRTTVHLNNFSLTNSWATNVPPFFVINSGGTLDNSVGNSNLTGHMAVVLNGGSLTNSGGGTFIAPGLITGYGLVSGPITVNGGLTAGPGTTAATSGTLTVDGMSAPITIGATGWGSSAGFVLDMKGTFNYPSTGGFLNPGGGTVQFDGATLNNTSGTGGHTIYTGGGSMIFASGTTTLNTAMIPNGSTGAVADYTVDTGATLNVGNPNTGVYEQPAIFAHNFTMQSGSVFSVAGAPDSITDTTLQLTGNFSYQQTNPTTSWTYGATAGLGPDLKMTGGTSTTPTTLEVGGINEGNVAAGFVDNFALDSLTVGKTGVGNSGYVELVDQYQNATPSGWTSGVEALSLDHLYGFSTTTYGVLNLDGLYAYLQGYGLLHDGIFTDPNGDLVDIIGAPTVPESSTWVMMLLGFAGLGFATRTTVGANARTVSVEGIDTGSR